MYSVCFVLLLLRCFFDWPHGSVRLVLLLIVLVIVFANMLSIVVCSCLGGIRDVVCVDFVAEWMRQLWIDVISE